MKESLTKKTEKKENVVKKIVNLINNIASDTLKVETNGVRRWNRPALTMFTAWAMASFVFMGDYFLHGFRIESFSIVVGVAIGIKSADALAQRIKKGKNES